jgi:hypothetical protein
MVFINYVTKNNVESTIATWISAVATTVTVASGDWPLFWSVFPVLVTMENKEADWTVAKREIVKMTWRTGDVLTIVRSAWFCPASDTAQTHTNTPFTFASSDKISIYLTEEVIDDIQNELERKVNIAVLQDRSEIYDTSIVWTDSYSIALTTPISAYTDWMWFSFKADVWNTWPSTLDVDLVGAITIKKKHNVDLVTGDIEAWQIVDVVYDWTNFQMQSQLASSEAWTFDIAWLSAETESDDVLDMFAFYDDSAGLNKKIAKPDFIETITGWCLQKRINQVYSDTTSNWSGATSHTFDFDTWILVSDCDYFTMTGSMYFTRDNGAGAIIWNACSFNVWKFWNVQINKSTFTGEADSSLVFSDDTENEVINEGSGVWNATLSWQSWYQPNDITDPWISLQTYWWWTNLILRIVIFTNQASSWTPRNEIWIQGLLKYTNDVVSGWTFIS